MKLLLAVLAILVALSVIGFVVKTLFWLGVAAALVFVGVAIAGAVKGADGPKSIR